MPLPSLYLNLEDDVAGIASRIKALKVNELVLVCPKRCQLFSDAINLKLLKKQTDLLGKKIFILTMDEKGQSFAQAAGFELKTLPGRASAAGVSDIQGSAVVRPESPKKPQAKAQLQPKPSPGFLNFLSKPGHSQVPSQKKPEPKTAAKPVSQKIPPAAAIVSEADRARLKPQPSRRHYALIGIITIGLILALLAVFVILPQAEVTVYAKTEALTRDMEVTLSAATTQPDVDKLALPAVKEAEIDETALKFSSNGKKEVGNKAAGSVVIYNFTRAPINLKAKTTTLTVGNKSYVLTQDALGIRPTAYKNAQTKEVDENTLTAPVPVVAAQGGETYNLPAGTRLEITNQIFGSKPLLLYAKNIVPIAGGTSRFLSYISDDDINSSRDTLAQNLVKTMRDKLSADSLLLLDKAFTVEQQAFSTDNPSGTETPTFQADLKAKITGLAFNQNDLESLITSRISQTLSDQEQLNPVTSDNLTYQLKSVDLNAQTAVVLVHYEGRAVWKVQLEGVVKQLAGKSLAHANDLLGSRPEIDRIDVTLSPAWQKTFPWLASNIKLKLVK